MPDMFMDIPGAGQWHSVELISKGWSEDRKYRIVTDRGPLLLRLSDIAQSARKRQEYEMLRRLDGLPIVISRPLAFGVCGEGCYVYTLLTWVEGEDANTALPRLNPAEQYALGVSAGGQLRQMHTLPAPPEQESWGTRFNRKIDRKIAQSKACPIRCPREEQLLAYIEENRPLLTGRPQCFQHGDYHIGNMIVTPDGQLGIIDFNRADYGDPWEEFNRIVWCARVSPAFASGRIDGYFNGAVPEEFFRLMALYIAVNQLSALPWAIPFGQAEVNTMLAQIRDVLNDYDNFNRVVPAWYRSLINHNAQGEIRMEKSLDKLTNEELWQLFPILLVPHDPAWAARYEAEQAAILQAATGTVYRIRHIGSTAVPGLLAKPTIDILLEADPGADIAALSRAMESLDYRPCPQPNNPPPHIMFLKGYTPRGFEGQVFHVHVRYPGDWDEPWFCAYLRAHPETAAA